MELIPLEGGLHILDFLLVDLIRWSSVRVGHHFLIFTEAVIGLNLRLYRLFMLRTGKYLRKCVA
jgi:hypothetical protein